MSLYGAHIFFTIFLTLFNSPVIESFDWQKPLQWNWHTIAHEWADLKFDKNFSFGVATSAFQIEGNQADPSQDRLVNNFTHSSRLNLPDQFDACGHWQHWQKDVDLIANLGVDSYRLSIGWDRIEPRRGFYDQDAVSHYKKLIKEVRSRGIDPWVCLFHFTLPIWAAEAGGFLNDDIVESFINFCCYMIKELQDDVEFFAVYNEPVAYAVEAYMTGKFPPHHESLKDQVLGFYRAGKALKNMLNAHVAVYMRSKKTYPTIQIGLIHMFHILDAASQYNVLERFIASQGNSLVNDTVLNFFRYGEFNWKNIVTGKNEEAVQAFDFMGVNYYRHQTVNFGIFCQEKNGVIDAKAQEETAADTGWAIYPEGLYRSIKAASELKKPIYVTEFGIADKNDTQRDLFIRRHLYAIKRAMREGCDVRGCFIWSLMDNYEWGCSPSEGPRFGLYHVDFNTFKRTLRQDAYGFVEYLNQRKK